MAYKWDMEFVKRNYLALVRLLGWFSLNDLPAEKHEELPKHEDHRDRPRKPDRS